MRIFKRTIIIFFSIIALSLLAFLVWSQFYYAPTEEALDNLKSTTYYDVEIKQEDIYFIPKENAKETAIIFYPGGKVDYRAYSYIGKISEWGYLIIIVNMPLRLAVLNPNAANNIIARNPGIKRWIIGGHSLGGSMASNYAFNNPDKISGLFLLGSYPPESNNFSGRDIKVISITGSKDGIINLESYYKSKKLLPEDTLYLEIKGGNHSFFGDYGIQDNDNKATIKKKEQHHLIINYIEEFIEKIE